MNAISYHVGRNNIGDMLSGPFRYFDDLRQLHVEEPETYQGCDTDTAVFGGGGMFTSGLSDILARARHESPHAILWGVGTNFRDCRSLIIPSWARDFTLAGIRDWNSGFDYVPCASCLHPIFDTHPPPPSVPVVVYSHHQWPISAGNYPSRINVVDSPYLDSEFTRVLAFLAFGETVLTNSYHGAYWAMLLGRRVVLWEPNTSKFFHFKHQPLCCDRNSFREMLATATAPPSDYLAECRTLNHAFKQRVMEVINA